MPKFIDKITRNTIWANRSSTTQGVQFQKNVILGEICIVRQIIEETASPYHKTQFEEE